MGSASVSVVMGVLPGDFLQLPGKILRFSEAGIGVPGSKGEDGRHFMAGIRKLLYLLDHPGKGAKRPCQGKNRFAAAAIIFPP